MVPPVPVVPLPDATKVSSRKRSIETDAPETGPPKSSTNVIVICKCLSLFFPPSVAYVIESTLTAVGVVGGSPTVILIEELPVAPPESVTSAVMVCVPSLRVVEKHTFNLQRWRLRNL